MNQLCVHTTDEERRPGHCKQGYPTGLLSAERGHDGSSQFGRKDVVVLLTTPQGVKAKEATKGASGSECTHPWVGGNLNSF